VASRVSAERCEPVCGLVGYSIQLEAKTSCRTRLLYVIYLIFVGVASRVSAERCEPVGGLV
jgi:hypothetical protein